MMAHKIATDLVQYDRFHFDGIGTVEVRTPSQYIRAASDGYLTLEVMATNVHGHDARINVTLPADQVVEVAS